mmetsp:Transcript_4239/g.8598  ORF Transcript_4239/g.8598 Transcript_4239/m.8598 type:complete len:273 (+) Transcript_4239:550-1368(+)
MRAKVPLRLRGKRETFSATAASWARRPSKSSRPVSEPCAARSTRPPGVSTEFPKLKTAASSAPLPFTASWQDIPPPESMPAQSSNFSLPAPGWAESSWATASHSAFPSPTPLRTSKLARSPRPARRRREKAPSCSLVSTPVSRALRMPAVAPTSTSPEGSCCARRSTRPAVFASSCKAKARGSPRQADFLLRNIGRPSTPRASEKWMPRVEPLPQSTTEMGCVWPKLARPGRKSTALSTSTKSDPCIPLNGGRNTGTSRRPSAAGWWRLLVE